MAGVGQQGLVRGQQAFGAVGGRIEGQGHGGDLVVAVNSGAAVGFALAPVLDAGSQTLQPPRYGGDQGVGEGAHHHGHGEQDHQAVQMPRAEGRAGGDHQEAAVRQVDAHGAGNHHPVRGAEAAIVGPVVQGFEPAVPGRDDQPAVALGQDDRAVEGLRHLADRFGRHAGR